MKNYKEQMLVNAYRITGIHPSAITSKSRKSDLVLIRDAIAVAIKVCYRLSNESIAETFGRDRTYVNHALRRHSARMEESKAYKSLYFNLYKEAQKSNV